MLTEKDETTFKAKGGGNGKRNGKSKHIKGESFHDREAPYSPQAPQVMGKMHAPLIAYEVSRVRYSSLVCKNHEN